MVDLSATATASPSADDFPKEPQNFNDLAMAKVRDQINVVDSSVIINRGG